MAPCYTTAGSNQGRDSLRLQHGGGRFPHPGAGRFHFCYDFLLTAQFCAVIHNAVSPKPPEKLPILISVPEAAKHLGYNLRHFYQLIQDGRFPVVRIGRRTLRVDTEKLKAYMRASEAVKPRAIIDRKTKRATKGRTPAGSG